MVLRPLTDANDSGPGAYFRASKDAAWGGSQKQAREHRNKRGEETMMNRMNALVRSEEGQGMTEYIIIVALIAIAAIAVITIFGQNLRALFAASSNALGGEEANANVSNAGSAGSSFSSKRKAIQNFGSNGSGEE
jgi:Flp pilus assembly pilin Flp